MTQLIAISPGVVRLASRKKRKSRTRLRSLSIESIRFHDSDFEMTLQIPALRAAALRDPSVRQGEQDERVGPSDGVQLPAYVEAGAVSTPPNLVRRLMAAVARL